MLQWLLIPVLGFAPGVFWLWLIYKRDKYRPEPKKLIIRTFVLGMAAIIPVMVVESILFVPVIIGQLQNIIDNGLEFINGLSLWEKAYFSFVIAGFTEELFKFLMVRKTVYKSPYFDEPIDGLMYSSAVALGFASLENVSYMLTYGWEVILLRAPISTLAHVVFSAVWGYPLGLHKVKKPRSTMWLWFGVIGAMLGHGLFDFFAFSVDESLTDIPSLVALIVLFIGMIVLFVFMLKKGQETSPYKGKEARRLIVCTNCGTHIPDYSKYCTNCGNEITGSSLHNMMYCSKCGNEINSETSYCPSCGSRIIKGKR